MTERIFNVSQPIVFADGTMQYSFREFVGNVDRAVNNAAVTAFWGSLGGSLSNQTDLQSALDGKATTAQGALADTALQPGDAVPDGQGVPAGGTAGQVLSKIDGTDYNTEWTTAAGGGGVYDIVKAKGNLSSASFANTENALPWNSPTIGSGSSNVTISGSSITIDSDGTYKFTVTLRTDSSNRTELFIRTYIDTGSGLIEDADETVSDYVSRDSDQDTGAVTLVTALELTDGDIVEFRGFGDCDGTCVGLDAGTILLVERVV
jgi:hypothetical protein